MRALVITLLILLAILLTVGLALSAETVPPIKKDCATCHLTHTMDEGAFLKAPLSGLCLECHPDRAAPAEHRVDIVPSMSAEELPLDEEGRMTCTTCHDPHGKEGSTVILRADPDKLCNYCHKK